KHKKMYVIESKTAAIGCMILSLCCLGSWPAILTLLERRGRLPQHTFLDFTTANLLSAIVIAFTLGEVGKSTFQTPDFTIQLLQDNWPSVLLAVVGGVLLSVGNLATQYALAFAGLPVTEVITASITVVIGTTLNYFLDDKINRAEVLFPGVGCFLIAVFLGAAVHYSNAADVKAKLESLPSEYKAGTHREGDFYSSIRKGEDNPEKEETDLESHEQPVEKAKAGTAGFFVELENKRAIKVFGKSIMIGLFLTLVAGTCLSLFSPAFNLATNDQWSTLPKGVPKLVVYTAFFYFSIAGFLIALILNLIFLYRPMAGLAKSSLKKYVKDSKGRSWAVFAGFLCGFGNGLQFMGGQAAGYAAADSVQALPLVSTFWGIILFGEYRRSSRRTYVLLVSMLLMFVAAVAILMASSGRRERMLGETTVPPSLDPQNGHSHRLITLYSLQPSPLQTAGVSDSDPVRRLMGCSETPLDELETRDEAMRKMIEGGWRIVSPNSVNGADDPLINVVGSVYIESGKMYMIESKGGAIACMLLALLFLGTWPAIMTLTERRGRLPQHTYLDYTITNLLAAVIIAFTLGQIGPSRPNFITQLSQDNWQSVMFAMAGGIVLSLGNLATQYAWAFVGLSVTEVVTSSITVVIGTTVNYFLDDRINRAEILFPGAACFLIAVCFGSAVHKSNAADNKSKLQNFNSLETASSFQIETNHANSGLGKEKAKEGTAAFLIELEKQRAIKVFGKSTIIGLAITFFAGICFSMFSPAFNLATNDQWHTLKHGVPKLTVYTAFFYFSISAFVIALILNIRFLYWPVLGLPRSSFKAYLNDWNGRGWSFLAGFLCGFGNGLQFMGGQAAGYAAADAVQALPLVSTIWGILLFGEYRRSSRRTYSQLRFLWPQQDIENDLRKMEKSPKRILSTFTNGCSMFKSVKMLGLPERCENADFFTSNNIDDRHYMILIILSRLQRPACEAPPDNATELSSRTCSFSGLLELLRSSVYQDFCSTALATSLYALIVHQSA
ncbi:hypothetical protein HID58_033653, partial [Brassica napus]